MIWKAIPLQEYQKVKDKKILSKRALQSILGEFVYIYKYARPARIFIYRILAHQRNNFDKKCIKLTDLFYMDIAWFLSFLLSFKGVTYLTPINGLENDQSYLDNCLTGLLYSVF